METKWLAHSARRRREIPAQGYREHVSAVFQRTLENLQAATSFASGASTAEKLQITGGWGATFHDLGKLENENQRILQSDEHSPLPYPHESAGAFHCLEQGQRAAAWLIHSHHQGLTDYGSERVAEERQSEGADTRPFLRQEPGLLSETQALLPELVQRHTRALGNMPLSSRKVSEKTSHLSTWQMRLMLSALVDADHHDTARNYRQEIEITSPGPRWAERLVKLEAHVAGLGQGTEGRTERSKRDPLRRQVYTECKGCNTDVPIWACDAPVGSGKTTAVMAYLLRAAMDCGLRRIFIVLPFTNIINQSVKVYRKALVLDGEDPEQVVAAHHHAAEFGSPEARGLTTLWASPIVVTTAVQFFETLAACATSRLRKLHALPGSAVFIDEAHAAMPLHLWPYMWRHLETLSGQWRCRFVLGSGSLPQLWKNARLFANTQIEVPSMLSESVTRAGAEGEKNRIRVNTKQEVYDLPALCSWIKSLSGARLVVMNTLQSAAVLARELRNDDITTLHLSTALTPADRDKVLAQVAELLTPEHRPENGWVLVATSCIEAGVDVSFDIALRERSSVSSLIQISGRVNRHGENSKAEVWDFLAGDPLITPNPSLDHSRAVVALSFKEKQWESKSLSDLVTWAITEEWKLIANDKKAVDPVTLENGWEFATVANTVKLIADDTDLAVVDRDLIARLLRCEPVKRLDLIRGSVAIRRKVIEQLALKPIPYREHLYEWPEGLYDVGFLGIMPYILKLKKITASGIAMT